MSEPTNEEWEQMIVDVMPFLVAPDQPYRGAVSLMALAHATPRLEKCADAWRREYGKNRPHP